MSEQLTLEQLKEELTRRGIEFHHASGLPKLSELWAIHSEDPIKNVDKPGENNTSEPPLNPLIDPPVETPPVDPLKVDDKNQPAFKVQKDPVAPVAKGKYKALRNVKHNGETYKENNRYDIQERDAKQLLKLGYIE